MKVLIVNKFFYPRGGDCIVAMGTRDILMDAGHDVRVYAMHHPGNISLPEAGSYASAIDFGGGAGAKLKALRRFMGMGDIRASVERVLAEFKPDVVHLHNVHSYLSPVVGELAKKRGARVVWTLHDLKLVCPSYLGRYPDGTVCDELLRGECSLMAHRCMKGSLAASLAAKMEAACWSARRLDKFTDRYIAPSHFMKRAMVAGGFPASHIAVLHNFVDPVKMNILASPGSPAGEPCFVYVGRLSREKGVHTLVKAAVEAGVKLRIAGDGPDREALEKLAAGHDIEFLGHLSAESTAALIKSAAATVLASEWYENNPLSVIESLCAGTPVIGADIGGIPELIEPGVNGEHFVSGDVTALASLLRSFNASRYNRDAIGRDARSRFSRESHLKQLLAIYSPT